ncbi:MAG TPA: hypothetical protein VHE80_09290 [Acidimicrobiales bacterium]|nr:hypothetical protein [Acidimicrobiales bacterium]
MSPVIPKSVLSEMRWPAVPSHQGATQLALDHQLTETQWLPPHELESLQLGALGRLLRHACRTVPYYRHSPAHRDAAGAGDLTAATWRRLPVLTRATVQADGPRLRSEAIPDGHTPVKEGTTSGSTGRPVSFLATRVTSLFWMALTLREHHWHERDLGGRLAVMRVSGREKVPPRGMEHPSWGTGLDAVYDTGPAGLFSIARDLSEQAAWLRDQDPDYVMSLPSNLLALAEHFRQAGWKLPRLRQVRSYGEAMDPGLRDACREAWGVDVVDLYSSQEVGYMALQCPRAEHYHVQSESVLVEVVDDDGNPCHPGQVGRVLVTALHNYAMPLLRYELGDYAEVGGHCPCGRTLPVLARVMGRYRNMLRLPTGERFCPVFSIRSWAHIAAIRQMQVVQTELDHLEVRIVGPRPLNGPEEEELAGALREAWRYPFRVSFRYPPAVERSASLKFESFVSLV